MQVGTGDSESPGTIVHMDPPRMAESEEVLSRQAEGMALLADVLHERQILGRTPWACWVPGNSSILVGSYLWDSPGQPDV